ncbi:MAG: hypothetical protein L6Q47_02705 [Ignavibacteriaceae bacterium]|nr:hypothetical protein [Ignavibacteriaceae bacterium]
MAGKGKRIAYIQFFFLLVFSIVQVQGQGWKEIYSDSELRKDTVLMTRDLRDKQPVADTLANYTKGECTIFMLYTPEIFLTFETSEYTLLMNSKSEKFEDYLYFLTDNDVVESLFMVVYDSIMNPIRIDRISTDININFGEHIYSYFLDSLGRVTNVLDWICRRDEGNVILYTITYDRFFPKDISYSIHERN